MTKRARINLLAAAIIAAGGLALGGVEQLQAAVFGGCEDMYAAMERKSDACFNSGGTSFSWSGSCSSSGYSLNTSCSYMVLPPPE